MIIGLRLLPFIAIIFLVILEDKISTPVCNNHVEEVDDDLKVMMVADLLLLGSDATYINRFFRDHYMSKFFRKSFESLKPDLLIVLGDVSAKGSKLTKSKWVSVLHQFYQMLGPFVDLPFHAILGDRDIGECSDLDANNVNWISRKLPGLDSSGCGAFEIGNVSFVSLNSVALLCDNSSLRFDVEKVIERESLELREETEAATKMMNHSTLSRDVNYNFFWRESTVLSGSGPVLLLHLPLDQTRNKQYSGNDGFERSSSSFIERLNLVPKNRDFIGTGLYNLLHTLPLNASEYILQALRPRIIFSAHRCTFSDHVHFDTTREIIVPAMSWNTRDDPGFVIATFQKTGKAAFNLIMHQLARNLLNNFFWRESTVLSGSGAVLLLHLPLDQTRNKQYSGNDAFERSSSSFIERLNLVPKNRDFIGTDLYNLLHTLPLNASEYILQALRPRIIFSAHRCAFSDHIHFDTT